MQKHINKRGVNMKIKIIIMTAFLMLSAFTVSCSSKAESLWSDNLSLVIEQAKQTNKPILINFTGSDWCGWCHKLRDEVFSQKEFMDYATANLILFEADFPTPKIKQTDALKAQNNELQTRYKIEGYPTIILIDKDMNELGRTGYQYGGAESYVAHLKELME
jgi:thioredoxin-related protein